MRFALRRPHSRSPERLGGFFGLKPSWARSNGVEESGAGWLVSIQACRRSGRDHGKEQGLGAIEDLNRGKKAM